jgi:hypothetical protein
MFMTRSHIATHAHYSLYLDEATQPEEVTQWVITRNGADWQSGNADIVGVFCDLAKGE